MNTKSFALLGSLSLVLLGAVLLLAGWSVAAHQQRVQQADALAAEGSFAAALQAYQDADAHYRTTFWGLPQGPILDLAGRIGFVSRAYMQLRHAEMAFREGERLLALYGRVQLATSPTVTARDRDNPEKPALETVLQHFQTAEKQYKLTQTHARDPYQQLLAKANRARTMMQMFLIHAFLQEPRRDPLSLKQDLVRAITTLQDALEALYTDEVRVSLAEEHSLVLLLEALTRFQSRPDEEAAERRRVDGIVRELTTEADMASLGEILRSSDPKALSQETANTMRSFMLNQSPETRQPTGRPKEDPRTGRGSADSGSAGSMH